MIPQGAAERGFLIDTASPAVRVQLYKDVGQALVQSSSCRVALLYRSGGSLCSCVLKGWCVSTTEILLALFFRGLFFDMADVQQNADGGWLQTGGCRGLLKFSDRCTFQVHRTEFFALTDLFVKKAGSCEGPGVQAVGSEGLYRYQPTSGTGASCIAVAPIAV